MLDILSNIAAFVFALGVIIFVHELGHLVVAKAFDTRVLAFSLGFGKRLWGFQRGDTEYRLSALPIGGYVRLGDEEGLEDSDDPRDFSNKPRWQRILVYLAGPAMNIILAVLLMAVVFMVGIEVSALPNIPAVVGSVADESPAATAGLRPGDRIVALDGEPVERWDEVQFAVLTSPEREIVFSVERPSGRVDLGVRPDKVPRYEFGDAGIFPKLLPRVGLIVSGAPAEAAGFASGDEIRAVDGRAIASGEDFVAYVEERTGVPIAVDVLRDGRVLTLDVTPADRDGKGKIGVELGYYQRFGPVEALTQSVRFNWQMTGQTLSVLGKIVTGKVAAKSALSGPIEIAALSGAAVRSGFKNLIRLMALISLSIAILNLMPIPVLDGGQITILMIESLRRRDLSMNVKERIHQVGFALIILLMVAVLWFDLAKNLPAGLLSGG